MKKIIISLTAFVITLVAFAVVDTNLSRVSRDAAIVQQFTPGFERHINLTRMILDSLVALGADTTHFQVLSTDWVDQGHSIEVMECFKYYQWGEPNWGYLTVIYSDDGKVERIVERW